MASIKAIRDVQPKYTQIFIDNEFLNAVDGNTFATVNPATLQKIADVQEANVKDVDLAATAARRAFHRKSEWRQMDASQRGRILFRMADLLERDISFLASLETKDNGKPFTSAVGDIRSAISCLRYFAGWADKIHGKTIPTDGPYFTYTRIEPVGVVGAILPWNFPVMLMANKVGPALAAGCTLIVKPAEQTPLTALHFAALAKEAGLPKGVLNIVPGQGPGAGEPLVRHPLVDKITFTGSTEVGRLIVQNSVYSNIKRLTLELGGKSPNIVFADADLDFAVEMSHSALFFNMGQCCVAGSRTFVQESIYDNFVEMAVQRANARTVGDPFEDVESGPQIDEEQYNKILDLMESGKKEGAKLMCGGGKGSGKGLFIQPTVFADVKDGMRIAKEEIFGPVQQILKFKTMDEAIERANATSYGLAASIFTRDLSKALEFANNVQAGNVWVNCYFVLNAQTPFGGFKDSGIGREGNEEGLSAYCEIKHVSIKLDKKL